MTCKRCRYEWCWVCEGKWSDHGTSWFNCNRFDEKNVANSKDNQAKSRASLERYLHVSRRESLRIADSETPDTDSPLLSHLLLAVLQPLR